MLKGAHRKNTSKEPCLHAYGPHTQVTFKYEGCNCTQKIPKTNATCDWASKLNKYLFNNINVIRGISIIINVKIYEKEQW